MGASWIAGLPVDVLVARFAPVFLGAAAAAVMLGFGRHILALPWWLTVLAVMCPFWVVGVPPIATGIFGTFMPCGGSLILSPFLAIILFFLMLLLILEGYPSRGAWRFLILVAFTFLATGARGAILLCALPLFFSLKHWDWLSAPERAAIAIYVFSLVTVEIFGSFAYSHDFQFFYGLASDVRQASRKPFSAQKAGEMTPLATRPEPKANP
jgi:hypothetical protein